MNKKVKRVFNRRILVKLTSNLHTLSNNISIRKDVQSGRELISGEVIKVPEGIDLHQGSIIVFPKYSMNEATRLGRDYATVDFQDIEWEEEIE